MIQASLLMDDEDIAAFTSLEGAPRASSALNDTVSRTQASGRHMVESGNSLDSKQEEARLPVGLRPG